MKQHSWVLFWVLLHFSIAQSPPLVPTTVKRVFSCPLCTMRFSASVVLKAPERLGQDSDFLPRYQGEQVILIAPVTCTNCYFSGDPESFDAELSQEQKEKLGQGIQPRVFIAPGEVSDHIPTPLRYELRAQTYQKLWETHFFLIAQQYLLASWAVRLTVNPLNGLEKKEKKEIANWLQKNRVIEIKDLGRQELNLAQEWRKKIDTISRPEEQWACIGALVVLFRKYGENTQVEALFPRGSSFLEKKVFEEWKQQIEISIEEEQFYQQLALEWFEKGFHQDPHTDINLFYLAGELSRRLGRWEIARGYYEKALAHPTCSESFRARLQTQLQWLPQ